MVIRKIKKLSLRQQRVNRITRPLRKKPSGVRGIENKIKQEVIQDILQDNKEINRENNIIQKLDSDIRKMKIGSRIMKGNGDTPYLESLLFPERAVGSKIPGMTDSTIAFKRKTTINATANVLGALGIVWQPNTLSDNTAGLSTLFLSSAATYNGSNVATAIATAMPQSTTAGSVQSYRLVSSSIHIIPQASVLNQQGTIHGALIKVPSVVPTGPPSGVGAMDQYMNIANIDNAPFYTAASISNMEGLRMIWIPNDQCLLEFALINTNTASQGGADESINTFCAVIVGATSGQSFRIDLYQNFEVTSAFGSTLQGMETICSYNEVPMQVWRSVLIDHKDDVVFAGRAISEIAQSRVDKVLSTDVSLLQSRRDAILPKNLPRGPLRYI